MRWPASSGRGPAGCCTAVRMCGATRLVTIVLTLALGCGREETYTASGDVVAVDAAGGRVTLTHDDIPGLMPAMTMAFRARSPAVLAGAAVGTRVRFELARDAGGLVVTRLVPL